MTVFFKLIRLHQWLKNLFVFAPAFFADSLFNAFALRNTSLAFLAFGLVASSIYIINDIKDVESDRMHPVKRFRPIAAGTVKVRTACFLSPFLAAAGLILSAAVHAECMYVLLVYLLLNIAYTFFLKRFAIVDVLIVALGFILRLFMGASALQIPLSRWIIVMTFLLAMFLALAKRRDDCRLSEEKGNSFVREALNGYSFQFIDISLAIMSSVLLVAYLLYCMSPEVIARLGEHVYLTFLFVVVGILRYLQRTFVFGDSGSPTLVLIKDRFVQLIFSGWLLTFLLLFYHHR